jgi:hypothetical protein
MCDASCRAPLSLTEHCRDVAPPVEPLQPDLAADDEPEEQDERSIFGRETPLGLHAASKLLVQRPEAA